jgi:hypothetical protein
MAFGLFVKAVAIADFEIHQNLFKYWFTLLHFVMDDPVCGALAVQGKI